MGILNITPDSFFDGGKYKSLNDIKNQISVMLDEGADIIDIGAFSSKPGSAILNHREEWIRLQPVLDLIKSDFSEAIISVDTCNSETAAKAIDEFSVSIINDISGGEYDKNMFHVVAEKKVPYVLMHMPGSPENMQCKTNYSDIMKELIEFFEKKISHLRSLDVKDIIIDPGFGFGKTLEQNYFLLKNLETFKNIFQLPLLVGISRKSMIYKALNSTPEYALNGTTALNTIALLNKADILRVHDVKHAIDAITLLRYLK